MRRGTGERSRTPTDKSVIDGQTGAEVWEKIGDEPRPLEPSRGEIRNYQAMAEAS